MQVAAPTPTWVLSGPVGPVLGYLLQVLYVLGLAWGQVWSLDSVAEMGRTVVGELLYLYWREQPMSLVFVLLKKGKMA